MLFRDPCGSCGPSPREDLPCEISSLPWPQSFPEPSRIHVGPMCLLTVPGTSPPIDDRDRLFLFCYGARLPRHHQGSPLDPLDRAESRLGRFKVQLNPLLAYLFTFCVSGDMWAGVLWKRMAHSEQRTTRDARKTNLYPCHVVGVVN